MGAADETGRGGSSADRFGDVPVHELDEGNPAHHEELRQRYYGLLQELRVLLPGVQVLVAFLLTAPFAARFPELDQTGRTLFGVSLWAGIMAVVSFVSPTVFHRIGGRTLRAERLSWGIRTTRAGLLFLAVALLAASLVVTRFVFDDWVAVVFVGSIAAGMLAAWVAVPLWATHASQTRRRADRLPPLDDDAALDPDDDT
jgi:hypothetical protein